MPKIDLDKLADSTIKEETVSREEKITDIVAKSMSLYIGLFSPLAGIMSYELTKFVIKLRISKKDKKGDFLSPDKVKVKKLVVETENRLKRHNIKISKNYTKLLFKMAQVMIHDKPLNRPAVITVRPGLGKTEMLITTIANRLQNEPDFTAVVVTRFIEEAVRIADEVNKITGNDECFVRPSFNLITMDGQKCELGYGKEDYKSNICKGCPVKKCPVIKDRFTYWRRRVVVITSAFFTGKLEQNSFNKFRGYSPQKGIKPKYRKYLFIDENPGLIPVNKIDDKVINQAIVHAQKSDFSDDAIKELRTAKAEVGQLMGGKDQMTYYNEDIDTSFRISDNMIKEWAKNPMDGHDYLPFWINELLEGEGIRLNANNYMNFSIMVGKYLNIPTNYIRTIILDGTGLIDKAYRERQFNILVAQEIRLFKNVTIHHYPINISKSFINDDSNEKLILIAKEIEEKSKGKESLIITYKGKIENNLKSHLEESPHCIIEHFGNLIGKNHFNHCTNVFFVGTNIYKYSDYSMQSKIIANRKLDLEVAQGQVEPFSDPFTSDFYIKSRTVNIYQDLMRCQIRKPDNKKDINIYIYTDDNKVISEVLKMLPGCKLVMEEAPMELKIMRSPTAKSQFGDVSKIQQFISQLPVTIMDKNVQVKKYIVDFAKYLGVVPHYNDLELVFGEKVQKSKSGRYKDYARIGLIEDFINKHDKIPDKIEMKELFEEKVNDKKYEKYKTISTKYLRKEKTPTKK